MKKSSWSEAWKMLLNLNYKQSEESWGENLLKQHLMNAFNEMNYHQIKSRKEGKSSFCLLFRAGCLSGCVEGKLRARAGKVYIRERILWWGWSESRSHGGVFSLSRKSWTAATVIWFEQRKCFYMTHDDEAIARLAMNFVSPRSCRLCCHSRLLEGNVGSQSENEMIGNSFSWSEFRVLRYRSSPRHTRADKSQPIPVFSIYPSTRFSAKKSI